MSAPTFSYECSAGHSIESTTTISACPCFTRGRPCSGELHAVGEGSQAENRRLREQQAATPSDADQTQPEEKHHDVQPPAPPAREPMTPATSTSIEVPLPRSTAVAIEALEKSLKRIPGHKSRVRDGVLRLEVSEAEAIDQATRDHARELLKADRAANSYRDVLLREIRQAIAAATGKKSKRRTTASKRPARKATSTRRKAS